MIIRAAIWKNTKIHFDITRVSCSEYTTQKRKMLNRALISSETGRGNGDRRRTTRKDRQAVKQTDREEEMGVCVCVCVCVCVSEETDSERLKAERGTHTQRAERQGRERQRQRPMQGKRQQRQIETS